MPAHIEGFKRYNGPSFLQKWIKSSLVNRLVCHLRLFSKQIYGLKENIQLQKNIIKVGHPSYIHKRNKSFKSISRHYRPSNSAKVRNMWEDIVTRKSTKIE